MSARVSSLPAKERPISEQFRIVAKQWAEADAAAHLMEELKTTTLEQKKSAIIEANPGMAENKAERWAKSSDAWEQYIRSMCAHRSTANLLRQKLEYLRMKHREWIASNADARDERRLGEMHP